MANLDLCHSQVVRALEKAGWRVDPTQPRLSTEVRTVFVDILAHKQTNGTREQILLAEVKCFSSTGEKSTDLYVAIGQYVVYKSVLTELDRPIPLYLAVPTFAYEELFDTKLIEILQQLSFRFVLVDLEKEEVVKWITL